MPKNRRWYDSPSPKPNRRRGLDALNRRRQQALVEVDARIEKLTTLHAKKDEHHATYSIRRAAAIAERETLLKRLGRAA